MRKKEERTERITSLKHKTTRTIPHYVRHNSHYIHKLCPMCRHMYCEKVEKGRRKKLAKNTRHTYNSTKNTAKKNTLKTCSLIAVRGVVCALDLIFLWRLFYLYPCQDRNTSFPSTFNIQYKSHYYCILFASPLPHSQPHFFCAHSFSQFFNNSRRTFFIEL